MIKEVNKVKKYKTIQSYSVTMFDDMLNKFQAKHEVIKVTPCFIAVRTCSNNAIEEILHSATVEYYE